MENMSNIWNNIHIHFMPLIWASRHHMYVFHYVILVGDVNITCFKISNIFKYILPICMNANVEICASLQANKYFNYIPLFDHHYYTHL